MDKEPINETKIIGVYWVKHLPSFLIIEWIRYVPGNFAQIDKNNDPVALPHRLFIIGFLRCHS